MPPKEARVEASASARARSGAEVGTEAGAEAGAETKAGAKVGGGLGAVAGAKTGAGASTDVEAGARAKAGAQRPLVLRWLRSFGAFWWDFLVGDTPELFVGALAAIGIVALLVKASSLNTVAVGGFPALVVVLLAASVGRERRSRRR